MQDQVNTSEIPLPLVTNDQHGPIILTQDSIITQVYKKLSLDTNMTDYLILDLAFFFFSLCRISSLQHRQWLKHWVVSIRSSYYSPISYSLAFMLEFHVGCTNYKGYVH